MHNKRERKGEREVRGRKGEEKEGKGKSSSRLWGVDAPGFSS